VDRVRVVHVDDPGPRSRAQLLGAPPVAGVCGVAAVVHGATVDLVRGGV
jgi:hypothetical protein